MRRRISTFVWIVIVSGTATLRPLRAQSSATLDAAERRAVVEQISQLLQSNYVFPDVAEQSAQHIKAQLAAGEFNALTDATAFADRLTRELQSINHDKHMRVRVAPGADARVGDEDPGAAVARQLRDMRSHNFGFERVEHLDGNVGYLDLRGFAPTEVARETAIAAMQFLSNSDAIIIDLRKNGGGSPDMVRLIASYFFPQRTHLNSLYWREGNRTEDFWTLEDLPGRKMTSVPVFVLTSNRTFSGGEEFAYDLQTQKRATLIGETTGGGANPGRTFRINDHFGIFIPTGRAINPVTRTNWEGVGVKPDVAVDAAVALDSALVRARAAALALRDAEEAKDKAGRDAFARELTNATSLIAQRQQAAGERAVTDALRKGIAAGILEERSINALGYQRLERGEHALAIAIFKFNVATFPKSSNVYDSLGEAYMKNGDRELAIQNYRKSLELDSGNQNAVGMLKKLQP